MNERLMFGSRLSNYNLHNNKGDLSIVQDCNFTGFWIASLKSLKLIQLSLTTLFSFVPAGYIQARLAYVEAQGELKVTFKDALPTREEQLSTLRNTEEFDVLVVGGGATGSGCALDAVTRSMSFFLTNFCCFYW